MNKKIEAWTNGCHMSIKCGHKALSHLYNGLETDVSPAYLGKDIPVLGFEHLTLTKTASLFTQFCQNLVQSLSSPTEGLVRFPLGSVLKLVTRCLGVTYSDVISMPSLTELVEVLPTLHLSAFNVLYHTILCCRTNLLPKGKLILELCLQALISTGNMEVKTRSLSRACVYQTLSLWLEVAGPGRYFVSKLKELNKEIHFDISLDEKLVPPPNGTAKPNSQKVDVQKKRGKGKKKGSRKAESYLASAFANRGGNGEADDLPQRVEATLWALRVIRLVAEKGQFLHLQTIMHCVVDTVATLQRTGPPDFSPYLDPECWKSLYLALNACALVPLDTMTNSAEAVAHFQLTHRALSLILHGGYSDQSIQVQIVCRNLLSASKATGSVNRPIVRKYLPGEQVELRDVVELDRQMEEMKEENVSLRRKLLGIEIEKQSQNRTVSALREEIEGLRRASRSSISAIKDQTDKGNNNTCSTEATSDDVDDMENEDSSGNEIEEVEESVIKQHTKYSVGDKNSQLENERHWMKGKLDMQGLSVESTHSRSLSSDVDSPVVSTNSNKGHGTTADKKRSLLAEGHAERQEKRSRINTNEELEQSDAVKAMIMDFVDADPDDE